MKKSGSTSVFCFFSALTDQRFAGEEQSLPRDRFQVNLILLQHAFELFDRLERNGKFCVDDGVDVKLSLQARGLELLL